MKTDNRFNLLIRLRLFQGYFSIFVPFLALASFLILSTPELEAGSCYGSDVDCDAVADTWGDDVCGFRDECGTDEALECWECDDVIPCLIDEPCYLDGFCDLADIIAEGAGICDLLDCHSPCEIDDAGGDLGDLVDCGAAIADLLDCESEADLLVYFDACDILAEGGDPDALVDLAVDDLVGGGCLVIPPDPPDPEKPPDPDLSGLRAEYEADLETIGAGYSADTETLRSGYAADIDTIRPPDPNPHDFSGLHDGPDTSVFNPPIDNPPVPGSYNLANVGEPVSVATGAFITSEDDLVIAGRLPIKIGRYYDSGAEAVAELGPSWRTNNSPFLDAFFLPEGIIIAPDKDGSVMFYANDTYRGCATSEDCWEDEFCTEQGFCMNLHRYFECVHTEECATDEYCNDDGECADVSDLGYCISSEDDCQDDEFCNDDGSCEDLLDIVDCLDSDDCTDDEQYCTDSGDCDDLLYNVVDCIDSADCSDDEQYCTEYGYCEDLLGDKIDCITSDDCPDDDQYCTDDGSCGNLVDDHIVDCAEADDCDPEQYCNDDALCEDIVGNLHECIDHDDCADTEYCDESSYECYPLADLI